MRLPHLGLLAALLLLPSNASAWGFEAHKFIVDRAIDLLPAELRPFFEANRAFIVERSIDPDLWRNAGFTEEPPNHFLDLDAYGAYPFTALPREYDAALKKYGIDELKGNGLLPWRTQEIAGRLIRDKLQSFDSRQLATFGYTGVPLMAAAILQGDERYTGLVIREARKVHGASRQIDGPAPESASSVQVQVEVQKPGPGPGPGEATKIIFDSNSTVRTPRPIHSPSS